MRKPVSVLMALMMLLCAAAQAETALPEEPVLLTSFDCTDLEGNPVDISLLDGAQVVVVDLWEAWCTWCLKGMPDLNELYELNKDQGLLVIGLSGIASADGYDAKETAAALNISYPLVSGTEEMVPVDLQGFPTTLIYQRQEDETLQLVKVVVGYKERDFWNEELSQYLPELVTEAVP